jgi:hypothetical protein
MVVADPPLRQFPNRRQMRHQRLRLWLLPSFQLRPRKLSFRARRFFAWRTEPHKLRRDCERFAADAIAILAAVLLLRRFSLSQFLVPAIGVIVGLHFIGLWKATDLSVFRWTALAMCVVCTFSLLLPGRTVDGTDARQAVAGLGSALALWVAGAATLF